MSNNSRTNPSSKVSKSEAAFKAAFDRIRNGATKVLPEGAVLSQNNVAREAGLDPSALKKGRFPDLVKEIQEEVEKLTPKVGPIIQAKVKEKRRENRSLRDALRDARIQRDKLASLLLEANVKIQELAEEVRGLKNPTPPSSNVTPFRR